MEIGIGIPEDVALVGFDDFELAETLEPVLTVIRQPAEQLGNVAANFLFNRIKSAEPHPEGIREFLSEKWVPHIRPLQAGVCGYIKKFSDPNTW